MSDDDVCGHPTQGGDGPPCQHPTTDDGDSDRCWIPDHNDSEVTTSAGGREFSINESDHERHNDRRQAMGLSWAEYIDGEAPEWPTSDAEIDEERLADVLVERLPERLARELEGRLR